MVIVKHRSSNPIQTKLYNRLRKMRQSNAYGSW